MASGPLVYSRKSHNKSSKFSVTPTLPSLPPSDDSRSSTLDRPQNSGFLHARRKITLSSRSKHEIRDIRRKLTNELNQVRILVKRLESHESDPNGGYSHSRAGSEVASAGPRNHRVRQLSISAAENSTSEKEKRTPKANQYYRNSEFVVGKEKFMRLAPPETAKKQVDEGLKECLNILTKLIKHKYGWVFAKPVDVKDLGLHDYYTIVKHPMDLGTVRSRLENNYYKSPVEFAEDVRLTFHNAMTYNPKGHDVHIMAEQLARLFEDRWADPADQGAGPPAHPLKKALPPELKRTLDRSESTNVRPDPKVVNVTPTGRVAAPKKPKAKDPHKRDMTFDEKQKLSSNLMNLPSEKLDNIVQIIKKRNTSLSHHDDEIEVDIDSFDAETLWELDRFVTNYKKSLSKYKRKAELAGQAGQVMQHDNAQDMDPVSSRAEEPKESKAVEKNISYTSPVQGGKHGVKASRSSSSSSSSSDSGSSSSGSESGSSSGRSGEGRSPRT